LDEADRLLDLGFEKDIGLILKIISEKSKVKRTHVLASATLSGGVRKLAKLSLNEPATIGLNPNYNIFDRFTNMQVIKLKSNTNIKKKTKKNKNAIEAFLTSDASCSDSESEKQITNSENYPKIQGLNTFNFYVPETLNHRYICVKRPFKSVALIGLLQMLRKKQK